MTKKQKKQLWCIFIAAAIFGIALVWPGQEVVTFALFAVSYLVVGSKIIGKAVQNIGHGQVFDENFLMTVATLGAFCLGEYAEGVAVMLFYQVGEFFQSYAVHKSRRSIADLMDIRPDYANIYQEDQLVQVDPEEVHINDTIVVKPGERIPLDGVVLDGFSAVDTSALTGESLPQEVQAGQQVISGCINQTGRLTIRVTKAFGQSTVAKILELVEHASSKKSKSENFITKFARYYTPVVVLAAVVMALAMPLLSGQPFSLWVSRALTFLVISCPCALVISIPLSFFGGIGGASKCGVLVKGSNDLEALARTKMVVFDKTGTLTKGSFAVSEIHAATVSQEELLELAAYAEHDSNHPIAVSIQKAYGQAVDPARLANMEEIPGYGVKVKIDNQTVLVGNAKLMKKEGIVFSSPAMGGTVVHVAVEGKYAGYLFIEDEIKEDSFQAVAALKAKGIQSVMLTGDAKAVGQKVAGALHLDQVYAELLPGDKVACLEELMQEKAPASKVAFVGDGINDAPVLARADIGIAMGGLGSDAAIEAADIVIMTDEPSKIATVIQIAQKTLGIVRQNIVFALGVKAVVLVLGALGLASMWTAVFADVGVSILAILNAIRPLRTKQYASKVLSLRGEKSNLDPGDLEVA